MLDIEAVIEFYDGDIPEYVADIGEDYITIRHSDVFEEVAETKITIRDVADYFAYQARSMSGMREISTFVGDWRNVDAIAQEMHALFKFCCVEEYRDLINREYSHIMAPGF